MTADTALRLSAFFGDTAEFWLNLQRAYDLAKASKLVDVSHSRPLKAVKTGIYFSPDYRASGE